MGRKRFGKGVIAVLLGVLLTALPVAAEVALIRVDYVDGVTLLTQVRDLFGDDARITFDPHSHSLLVVAPEETVAAVRKLVKRLDRPAARMIIRVRIRRYASRDTGSSHVQGTLRGSSGKAGPAAGIEGRIRIRAGRKESTASTESERYIRVASGGEAFIYTGVSVLPSVRWRRLCRKYAPCGQWGDGVRARTGFSVIPILRGDRVRLTIAPRLEWAGANGVVFSAAATRIDAPIGKWIDIGGLAGSENSAVQAILGTTGGNTTDATEIQLRVERNE